MIPSDWIERAHAVRIEDEIERRGIKLVGWVDRCGPCPQCGGKDRFSINVRKQVFLCRGCAARGNVIALVRFLDGCGFHEALERLTGERLMKAANVALAQHLDEAEAAPSRPAPPATDAPRDDDRDARDLTSAKTTVFGMGRLLGSPGETYFRDVRRIDTEAIADVLERIDAIGWHPAVYFNEPGHALHGRKLGASIAVMTDPVTAESTGAISRTYIHEGRKVGKAKTLGKPAGIVRLSEDADVLEGLHIAEGLETALDVMAEGFRPCWSTGSTAIMAKFPVLSGIEALTVIADHDLNGAGLRAAGEAADRWQTAGRETHVFQRETSGDFNDAFREIER
jgi:Toprim domain/CHC2 zinc finger